MKSLPKAGCVLTSVDVQWHAAPVSPVFSTRTIGRDRPETPVSSLLSPGCKFQGAYASSTQKLDDGLPIVLRPFCFPWSGAASSVAA